ncbi:succinate dehydrogenase / fumarate reductase cytochrome b subunit [Novosphingobium capsulatum]|uniref:Succinate dehydrogenase cytochrome b556 subunit n=1 Tax=Novosphingobium capsulatum TaxID=13688 RepID=A0ABU1MHB8_9SPHN|nr:MULTISPECIES: succinate dehydrogenase, cytochrome b556 subunit [Novosphingobium]KPF55511.1 succinate dehydrogenase [Novosphingobium sp. AAP1]MBB3357789.1 succinate dehydrogenase / fumarate reductase cytochrome b subunit [Novosphingobium sp. BK256]MBB3373547.1 succinate dehydrogenase / fumarate reductase cytochrome b subunit [Novosphingobium sp. BK280]MBB3377959.1 succinate dehydrogenase / fumarate reductase cytochrome b subunit [Novosphingobium sp. BK258]MBB3420256.1 succinate dehydrogenase
MALAHSNRPLSPHLQIWRWGPAMLVSILHRVTGNGLAFVGLSLLLWWLGSIASGPEAYATFMTYVWTGADGGLSAITAILGKIVLVGLSWAFFQHAATGIRHLVLDIGVGYELSVNARWSVFTMIASVGLTALFWGFVLLR